jgi:hypothetical protein
VRGLPSTRRRPSTFGAPRESHPSVERSARAQLVRGCNLSGTHRECDSEKVSQSVSQRVSLFSECVCVRRVTKYDESMAQAAVLRAQNRANHKVRTRKHEDFYIRVCVCDTKSDT